MYRYALSVFKGEMIEEHLYRRQIGRGAEATLFNRVNGNVELGSSLRRKRVNTDVDPMMRYLSFLAINYSIEAIEKAFRWFLGCHILGYSEPSFEGYFIEPRIGDVKRFVSNYSTLWTSIFRGYATRATRLNLKSIYSQFQWRYRVGA